MPSLRALCAAGHQITLVVTQPDRRGHRLRLTPPPIKLAASALGLRLAQPERVRDAAAIQEIAAAAPELLVVAAYGQIVPRELLDLPPSGALNVHASLLPRWRGAAPVNRAILAGDEETGVTIMRMDEQLDHGPVLARRPTPIHPDDDAPGLTARLAALGAELLVEVVGDLDAYPPVEQDHPAATLAPRLRKEEARLDWRLNADEIDRRVRGLRPWPGTTAAIGQREMKLLSGRPVPGSGRPGAILASDGQGLTIACGQGAYLVEEVQLPGRRPLAARQLQL